MIPSITALTSPAGEFLRLDSAFVLPEEVPVLIDRLNSARAECQNVGLARLSSEQRRLDGIGRWPRPNEAVLADD